MTVDYEGVKNITVSERDGIVDSVSTIASTPYGSAPFIRNMGIKNYPPESESDIAMNTYATEVITQCGLWEDRVSVASVGFENGGVKVVIGNV
jgi:phage baseplate assembly protein W